MANNAFDGQSFDGRPVVTLEQIDSSSLSPHAFRVYGHLYMNYPQRERMSVNAIAATCRIKPKIVQLAIKELIKVNFITTEELALGEISVTICDPAQWKNPKESKPVRRVK